MPHQEEPSAVIRRVLVALDESDASRTALEAATELAARFEAELVGLFVQDANLTRLSQIPFVREVGRFSASRHEIDNGEMARHLHIQALRMRRTFADAVRQRRVRWRFRVERGQVEQQVISAARQADILIVGASGWTLASSRRLGRTVRAIIAQAPSSTLVLQPSAHIGLPILAVYDGGPSAAKALETAASLTETSGYPLYVLLLPDGRGRLGDLRVTARRILRQHDVTTRYLPLIDTTARRLADAARTQDTAMLVLPAESDILQEDALLEFVERAEVPVLLVR